MALRTIRRPLALFLLPWLLALLAGVAAVGIEAEADGSLPTGGCTFDPNGCS